MASKKLFLTIPGRTKAVQRSARRVVLDDIRMSQRSQIERLKFGGLRNKRVMRRVPVTCSDQCEY
jgi:hypothetical protein